MGQLRMFTTQGKAQINCVTQATDWAIKLEKEKTCLLESEIPEQY